MASHLMDLCAFRFTFQILLRVPPWMLWLDVDFISHLAVFSSALYLTMLSVQRRGGYCGLEEEFLNCLMLLDLGFNTSTAEGRSFSNPVSPCHELHDCSEH